MTSGHRIEGSPPEEAVVAAETRTHGRVRYLYADYRGAQTAPQLFAVLESGGALLKKNPDITSILCNFTGAPLPPEFVQALKELGMTEAYKTALVGIEGFKKVIVDVIDTKTKYQTRVFDDEVTALEWLVS
jgi:hypothetical protein